MESLALLVFGIFCAAFLCGPIALGLAYGKFNVLAAIAAIIAIWLGIYWFATIYTWAKYLGVLSALCGLLALLKVAGNFYDQP